MSPSESNSTSLRSGRASARPSANPAWPPIAGSPSGTSSVGSVRLLDPIAAAAAGDDDRVAAMGAEGVERLGNAHHVGSALASG